MIDLNKGRGRGEWWPIDATPGNLNRASASIHCPQCDFKYYLEHEIAEDGTVSPSIVCPTPGCGFHDHVRLIGWTYSK